MTKTCGRTLRIALATFVLAATGAMQASGVSTTLIVPIVLSSQGLGGSFNVSEMTLTNRGTSESAVTFSYTAAFGGGGGVATDTLPAGCSSGEHGLVAWADTARTAVLDFAAPRAEVTSLVTDDLGAPLHPDGSNAPIEPANATSTFEG